MRRIGIVALAAGVIVAGTFPWDLQDHAHWYKVAWVPFVTGIVRPHDLLINVLLYLPLGVALQAGAPRDRRWLAACAAAGLAAVLELTQVWSHARYPSATDWLVNVVGSVAGAAWANRRKT